VALRSGLIAQRCAFLVPDTERVLEIVHELWQRDQRLLLGHLRSTEFLTLPLCSESPRADPEALTQQEKENCSRLAGGAETHLFRTCFLSLGFNAMYSSCGIPHRLSFVSASDRASPAVLFTNRAFQFSVGFAVVLHRLCLSKSAGSSLKLEYDDDELDAVEWVTPDRAGCVPGEVGTR
jgi:hypothetical protein